MPTNKMTPPQKRIYEAIINYETEHEYPPSIREICKLTGYKSTSTVFFHMKAMIDAGFLETDTSDSPRAIRVPGYKFIKEDDHRLDFQNTIQLFEYIKELENKELNTFGMDPDGKPYNIREILTDYFKISETFD